MKDRRMQWIQLGGFVCCLVLATQSTAYNRKLITGKITNASSYAVMNNLPTPPNKDCANPLLQVYYAPGETAKYSFNFTGVTHSCDLTFSIHSNPLQQCKFHISAPTSGKKSVSLVAGDETMCAVDGLEIRFTDKPVFVLPYPELGEARSHQHPGDKTDNSATNTL